MTSSGVSSPKSRSVAPRKRFVLTGRSPRLDPARDMVRDDLADVELADRVFAPHYARAVPRTVARDATVRAKPREDADATGTLAAGATVELFDVSGGWAWIRSGATIGYVPRGTLNE